jgi:hypothetical protein
MRSTCCSSLRQGSLFQATLRSSLTWAAGAFLSAIRVTFYPPYEPRLRQHILGMTPGVGDFSHLPLDDIGWNRRVVATTDASPSRVPTFRSDVFCCLRSCTLHRAPYSTGEGCTGSILPEGVGSPTPGTSTVLVKLISPSQLAYLNDGSVMPSIHSLLRKHFAIATRFRLLPLRTHGVLASHPASWIDVQSLPRGCSFPTPVHRVRICTSHHPISCVKVSFYPSIPKRVASFGRTCRTPLPDILVLRHLPC